MNTRRAAIRFLRLMAWVWLLAAPPVQGANLARDYLTDVWTSENGLPDSSVTAIAQTPDGYLWIGTYNGVARFDGVRFVTFDPANTPALVHARVRKLNVDSQGTLWINTYDGSLTTYRQGAERIGQFQRARRRWERQLRANTGRSPTAWRTGQIDPSTKSLRSSRCAGA